MKRATTIGAVGLALMWMGASCGGRHVLGEKNNATNGSDDGGPTGGSSGSGGSTGGSGGSSGSSATDGASGATNCSPTTPDGTQATSDKLDLLLVVDNSPQLADKQDILRRSARDLLERLTNPLCVGNGIEQPATPDTPCTGGRHREMTPVRDMNIGIVTSSLGGHGGDECSPQNANWNPTQNDKAHLIATVRPGTIDVTTTYQSLGFLKWDPQGLSTPPGESNIDTLIDSLSAEITAAGEQGCGFESTLEAAYRFLVDPEPPADVVVTGGQAFVNGIDNVVLQQRADFLRNDSAVLVAILSDEDDCSTIDGGAGAIDGGPGWLMATTELNGSIFHLPRATAACATDPLSPCCRSCGLQEASPPSGCSTLASDPECAKGAWDDVGDNINLRCWDQKRRFGIDFLYPIDRYVTGFTSPQIYIRNIQPTPTGPQDLGGCMNNPLFAGGRHPSLVSVAAIVGVPWQDIARNPDPSAPLEFSSASELDSLGRWPQLEGDPSRFIAPTNPYMVEQPDPRSGTDPITGIAIAPPDSTSLVSPINGHEYFTSPDRNELQYSCIMPIPTPRDCGTTTPYCDCRADMISQNKPLCDGTIQTYVGAFPGLRHLAVIDGLGNQGVLGSICSRNVTDDTRLDYAYRPVVGAIVERLSNVMR